MGDYQNVQIGGLDPVARTHLYRYYCARGYMGPEDVVVDAACGVGYGTRLFAEVASKAIGIDRDETAIQTAMKNNQVKNNYFIQVNLDQEPSLPECDVFVTIETLEHLRYPESFAGKVKAAARKWIFVSTPIVPTKHEDPTHLHDFTEPQVMEMFESDRWKNLHYSVQGIYMMAAFRKI